MNQFQKTQSRWPEEMVVSLVSLALGVLLVLSWLAVIAVMAIFSGCAKFRDRAGQATSTKIQTPELTELMAPTRTGSSVAAAVLPPAQVGLPSVSVEWDGQWPIYRLEYETSIVGPWRTYAWLTNWNATRATNHWVQSVQTTNPQMFFRVAAAHL